jgi:antirestriction protein
MIESEAERRLWVGCLSCYNAGRLRGAWLTAEQCAEPLRESAPELASTGFYALPEDAERVLNGGVPTGAPFDRCTRCGGDEWWGMDVEGLPVGWSVEMSPVTFADRCAVLASLEDDGYDAAAYVAWLDHTGEDAGEVDGFRDAYCGEYGSEAEYAEHLAEDMGAIDADASWPCQHIDWERAARDLFMCDNWSAACPSGGVYVFRSF